MSSYPRMTVVMLAYNHAPFVAQAIESVLIQKAPFPFELIIGDDCSADDTRAIVSGYASRHPDTVATVFSDENVGYGAMLRRVIEASRGELIAYLDADDFWTSPAKLRRQAEYLDRHSECVSCFHDVSLVYDVAAAPSGAITPGLGEGIFSLEDILKECFLPTTGMMFRRDFATTLPLSDFESAAWVDWWMHLHAARLGPLGYMPETLGAYRIHAEGMFSSLDRSSQLEGDLRFYEHVIEEFPEQRELIERCVANRHCQLAVERLGVPFDACVVLLDPRREMRAYFNGRHARSLPRRDGREVTELRAIRAAATELPIAARHYGQGSIASDGKGSSYVVVPAEASEWLAGRPQLAACLRDQGRIVWTDRWGTIHELEPPTGVDGRRASRRVVSTAFGVPAGLVGANLEAPPVSGALMPAHAVSVGGWVLGDGQPVEAVEFAFEGELLWRAPVQLPRADIVEAFPERQVGHPGFQTTLNAQDLPAESEIEVSAVLGDGTKFAFATLHFPA